MRDVDLVFRTILAELGQRCVDPPGAPGFPLDGRFVRVTVKGRAYLYFDDSAACGSQRAYVGPASDPDLARRVRAHRDAKDERRARRKLVSTLTRQGGMAAPGRSAGDRIAALADAGVFRRGGVLLGPEAFRCYPALLGVHVPASAMRPCEGSAPPRAIRVAIRQAEHEAMGALRRIDPSFREIPSGPPGSGASLLANDAGDAVELVPTSASGRDGPDDQALGFLVADPVRTVLLHGAGHAVTVPCPGRSTVHGLIACSGHPIGGNREGAGETHAHRVGLLASALGRTNRGIDLADAFVEAWGRGSAWRDALRAGMAALPDGHRDAALATLRAGLRDLRTEPAAFGL